jgi:hypothetical protein
MHLRKVTLGAVAAIALVAGGFTAAQNINPHRHPNLAAAQSLIDQAIGRIDAAQHANEFDMGGHAARAKDLLVRANQELKAAAMEANENRR